MPDLPATYERRVFSETWGLETDIRADSAGFHFSGYAAVFDMPSRPLPFIETINRVAFTRTLASRDIKKLFVNHNQDIVLGSTKRTLRLTADSRGVLAEADLPDNEWGRPIADAIRRGDIDSMSFGFTTRKDHWSDTEHRELLEVDLHEVSIVTGFAAYDSTTAGIRNIVVPTFAIPAQRAALEAYLAR